jgi:ABC-type dipeptide/oligopeptide/nickel transport system permease subunit
MTADTLTLQAPASETTPKKYRFLRGLARKKLAMFGLVIISIFYFCGLFAPLIVGLSGLPEPNEQPRPLSIELRNASPTCPVWLVLKGESFSCSNDHLFGTDALGRDILSRVIYAARTTLIFTVLVVVMGGGFLGVGLGMLAGYRGGWIDTSIMRVGEVLSGIPTLILMLAIVAAFRSRITELSFDLGDNTWLSTEDARAVVQFIIIIGVSLPFAWVGSSRIVRSVVLSIREQQYIQAAESMGASTRRIIFRHVFPGVLPLWVVGISGSMGAIALTEVSLSFLGLGITPPTASFGSLIQDGAGPLTFKNDPHLLLAPAIPVVLFILAWNLLGDALIDLLEPRSSTHR